MLDVMKGVRTRKDERIPSVKEGLASNLDALIARIDAPDGRVLGLAEIRRHGTPL